MNLFLSPLIRIFVIILYKPLFTLQTKDMEKVDLGESHNPKYVIQVNMLQDPRVVINKTVFFIFDEIV